MGHVFSTDETKKGRLLWCLGVGTLLMAALKIGDPSLYTDLGTCNLKVKEASEFSKKLDQTHPEWWFTLILTGGGLFPGDVENKELVDIYRNAGFVSKEEASQWVPDFGQWNSGWGHSSRRFNQIYTKIEEISSWN